MSTVTSVEKTGPVYRIYTDGRLMMRIDRISFEHAPLYEGDEIDEESYLETIVRVQGPLAYEAALTSLDRAGKSEKALRRWLSLRGFQDEAIDSAIARLHRAHLLDDASHAERVVESAVTGGLSRNAIKRKLRQKGIEEEDAEKALSAVTEKDQLASARKLADRLRPRYSALESRAARAKLSQALARRGFSWDVINQALSDPEEW